MTDQEKAIVMAYTGVCMLTGDKFQVFHEYVEKLLGRPVYTHEMAIKAVADEIKEKAKADFMALCSKQESRWIPVSKELPKPGEYDGDVDKYYLVQNEYGDMMVARYTHSEYWEQIFQTTPIADEIVAWMPLPEEYKPESEDENDSRRGGIDK